MRSQEERLIDPVAVTEPSMHAVTSPNTNGWSLFGVALSARILAAQGALSGGDWCEAFALEPGIIGLSIGDVCGHGDATFALRMHLRQAIRDAAQRGLDPAQTLVAAHYALRNADPDAYATALFALIDVEARTLTFANAGHPPPVLCSMTGARFLAFDQSDLPLGIEQMTVPALHAADVPDAALLVLYTDGVTEHQREPLCGEAQLRDAVVFAYHFRSLPTAAVIEKQMHLVNGNADDAAILAAWLPRRTESDEGRRL